ncbi:MAG: hypothetical protein ACYSU0_00060 [Planctomycetota bacterium]
MRKVVAISVTIVLACVPVALWHIYGPKYEVELVNSTGKVIQSAPLLPASSDVSDAETESLPSLKPGERVLLRGRRVWHWSDWRCTVTFGDGTTQLFSGMQVNAWWCVIELLPKGAVRHTS